MTKLITVGGRTLEKVDPSHSSLSYEIVESDTPAQRTTGHGNPVLIQQIGLQCACSGDYVSGTSTFVGMGTGAILAQGTKVTCNGQPIILEGDEVTITCTGTVTTTSTSATAPGSATIKVRVANTNQPNIIASEE